MCSRVRAVAADPIAPNSQIPQVGRDSDLHDQRSFPFLDKEGSATDGDVDSPSPPRVRTARVGPPGQRYGIFQPQEMTKLFVT